MVKQKPVIAIKEDWLDEETHADVDIANYYCQLHGCYEVEATLILMTLPGTFLVKRHAAPRTQGKKGNNVQGQCDQVHIESCRETELFVTPNEMIQEERAILQIHKHEVYDDRYS